MSILTEIVAGVRVDLRARMAEVRPEILRRRAESRNARMTPEAVGAVLQRRAEIAAGREKLAGGAAMVLTDGLDRPYEAIPDYTKPLCPP
ncbi:hypothetical protein GCM10010387_36430 [Streptomyces inusitatus]|uniref:Uncharacterized protein n=1 Tax=Streptomyces inusitatus TaxID=68221 RepID=A0A918Q9I5_9ACTN|nr:hypothetical protein [Streptomyces inusitatus]GGZ38933.1 hypothetical protein GCM10010387_36430 [Streptomyces inusitatus]